MDVLLNSLVKLTVLRGGSGRLHGNVSGLRPQLSHTGAALGE